MNTLNCFICFIFFYVFQNSFIKFSTWKLNIFCEICYVHSSFCATLKLWLWHHISNLSLCPEYLLNALSDSNSFSINYLRFPMQKIILFLKSEIFYFFFFYFYIFYFSLLARPFRTQWIRSNGNKHPCLDLDLKNKNF